MWLLDTVVVLVCHGLAPASTSDPTYPLPGRHARHTIRGGSLVGGHGDVFSGGSTWTVTGPLLDLFDLLALSCSLVMFMFNLNAFNCGAMDRASRGPGGASAPAQPNDQGMGIPHDNTTSACQTGRLKRRNWRECGHSADIIKKFS
jgi:hypothetical protein